MVHPQSWAYLLSMAQYDANLPTLHWTKETNKVMTSETAQQQQISRKRKRPRRRQSRKALALSQPPSNNQRQSSSENKKNSNSTSSSKPASSFLEKMKARLSGGHFRMINEKLYTCTGDEALHYFKDDPVLFDMYHAGYQEQMSQWPEQPVNIIIKWLKDHSSSLIVADFGCGEALIARSVKNKVYSFDLVSKNPSVISCDMSDTPLDSSSVNVAVFCLSLMGSNYPSYLQEAHRVLMPCGWLLIAEVKSRFDPTTGGADPNKFSKAICELGFTSVSKDFSNKMFILFYFKKKEKKNQEGKKIEWPELKPCLYKRR